MVSNGEIEREEARERGILSGSDRKWLLMDRDAYVEEYSSQYWGQRRDEVQDRVRDAILDFTLLFEYLDPSIRKEIFGNWTPHMEYDNLDFEAGIRDGLAFLLEGTGGDSILDEHTPPETTTERIFKEALERLAWWWGYNLNTIHLEIEAEKIPVRELLRRLDAGEELTTDELVRLVIARRNEVDPRPLQDQLREQLLDTEDVGE